MKTRISLEELGDPTEIEVSDTHAVFEYQVVVRLVVEGVEEAVQVGIETVQVGWKWGDEKPSLVMIYSQSAQYLVEDPTVLGELREAVKYQRDLLREMN